jgi:hypothetical protein
MLTLAELQQLRALEQSLVPGEWIDRGNYVETPLYGICSNDGGYKTMYAGDLHPPDAPFIALARNRFVELLDLAESALK